MSPAPHLPTDGLRALAWLGWGLVSVPGCAPDPLPLPPVVWEGSRVRVRMDDPEMQVCGGTFEALDRHAALVREALLLEGEGIVEYSIGGQDFVDAGCVGSPIDSVTGCSTRPEGNVFTTIPFLPHEIVHALRSHDPKRGRLSPVFEEGLAVMFGSDQPGTEAGPLDVLDRFHDASIVGGVEAFQAGHSMAILLDRHPVEALRDFDALARVTSEDAAFLQAFGETKEEFAAAAETMPICEQSQWWVPLLECDGEPTTADPETGLLVLRGNLSCGEPDVKGPEYGRMWTSRRFRLDAPTSFWYSYDFDFPKDAILEIVGCNEGCPKRFAYIGMWDQIGGLGDEGLGDLEPGEYFLRLSRPVSDDDGAFELVIDPS